MSGSIVIVVNSTNIYIYLMCLENCIHRIPENGPSNEHSADTNRFSYNGIVSTRIVVSGNIKYYLLN